MTITSAAEILDRQFLEMRWRCLSLAADLDRLERAAGGDHIHQTDERLRTLQSAIAALLEQGANRAETIQNLFSDKSAPPERTRASRV